MGASGERVAAVGDTFTVHMDREALNDYPLGLYDVLVTIVKFVPDREIAWTPRGQLNLGHVYGYELAPIAGRNTCDLLLRLVVRRPRVEGRKYFPCHSRGISPRHTRHFGEDGGAGKSPARIFAVAALALAEGPGSQILVGDG